MAVVMADFLTGEEFLRMFSLIPKDKGYAILDRPETSLFIPISKDTDWTDWENGRVFNEEMDLRWQKKDERFHVVMILDAPKAYFRQRYSLNLSEKYLEQKARWLLWGQQETKGKWIERRIPKIFTYPFATRNDSRIALSVKEYVNIGNQRVEFYRFTGLEEV